MSLLALKENEQLKKARVKQVQQNVPEKECVGLLKRRNKKVRKTVKVWEEDLQ